MVVFMVEVWVVELKVLLLISFTRLESWLNTSRWLLVSTLCRGIISCHFEVDGHSGVAWEMAPLRGEVSIESGEWCHCLGLGECYGMGGEEVPETDPGGKGGAP